MTEEPIMRIGVVGDENNPELRAAAQAIAVEIPRAIVRILACDDGNEVPAKTAFSVYQDPQYEGLVHTRMRELHQCNLIVLVAPCGTEALYWAGYTFGQARITLVYAPARIKLAIMGVFGYSSDIAKLIGFIQQCIDQGVNLRSEAEKIAEKVGAPADEAEPEPKTEPEAATVLPQNSTEEKEGATSEKE